MDITFISDTHGLHDRLKLNSGTVLVHAGDITEYGSEEEGIEFLEWFSRQPFTYKIFIGGNHDLFLETLTLRKIKKLVQEGIIYLQNNGTEIEGIKFWGSPVTPYFLGMAFNEREGNAIRKVWNKIPFETDVLITHGPPKGILDGGMGCDELHLQINRVRPKIHCFGHVHGQNGMESYNGTNFINASMVNRLNPLENATYKLIGKPITCLLLPTIDNHSTNQ
ncbi:MAG: metallophosphatase domain-containing protein [Mariniphaga sp.]